MQTINVHIAGLRGETTGNESWLEMAHDGTVQFAAAQGTDVTGNFLPFTPPFTPTSLTLHAEELNEGPTHDETIGSFNPASGLAFGVEGSDVIGTVYQDPAEPPTVGYAVFSATLNGKPGVAVYPVTITV